MHIIHGILTPVYNIHRWMIRMGEKIGKHDREEDTIAQDCGQGALLVCPAASPAWVFVQTNAMHVHLQDQASCFF